VPKIALVCFDVDNTLFKEKPGLEAQIFNAMYAVAAKKLDIPRALLKDEYNKLYEEFESHSRVFKELGLPPELAKEIYDGVDIAHYLDKDPELVNLFAHVREKRIPYSIYTNSKVTSTLRKLGKLGLGEYVKLTEQEGGFAFVLTGEAFPKAIGSTGFDKVIENAGVSPEQILFVGDRKKVDILPAREKGMMTAHVWQPGPRVVSEDRMHYTLPDVYSVKAIVDSLELVVRTSAR